MSLSFADLLGQVPAADDDDEDIIEMEKRVASSPFASTSSAAGGGESEDGVLRRHVSRLTIMRGLTYLLLGVVLLMSGVALGLTAAAILGANTSDTTIVQSGLVRHVPTDITLTPNTGNLAPKGDPALTRGGQGDDGTALRNPLGTLNLHLAQAAHRDDNLDQAQPDGPNREQAKRLGRRRDGPAGGARLPRESRQRQRHGNGAAAAAAMADVGRRGGGTTSRGGRGGQQQQQQQQQ